METDDMDKLRRTLLKQALAIPGALALSAIDIDRLLAALAKPSNMNEANLEHIATINEHCWRITNTSELASIDEILPTYLPHLAATARQSFKHQREAAAFAAQGYLLAGLVALDRLDFPGMERYSELAVEYSKLAGDYNLRAAALKQQATMFLIAKEPFQALQLYQQVLPFITKISPLLRSRVYQGLADASARVGQDAEAMRYVGLAYETFPTDFEKDTSFLYADSGLSVLYMYDGLTYLAIDQPGKAMEAFDKVDGRQPKIVIGETTSLEFINLQGKAAVAMRNQELARDLIEAAVVKADALDCRWGRTEAFEVYQQARLVWPNDVQVREMAQLFRH
jgi:tetratricopeptide (TPR) repeat protein